MAVFEFYGQDGTIRLSSDYPTYQYISKETVSSFGNGVVTSNNPSEWDIMKLGSHIKEPNGTWTRYLFDVASNLPLPPAGTPSLSVYDQVTGLPTFIINYPVMNILNEYYIGEPEYTPSLDYRTLQIPMNGRKVSLSRVSSSGPTIWVVVSTYTYAGQTYYNYRVTNYWIEPVFDYANDLIKFQRVTDSYISEGHSTPVQNSDNYLTLGVLTVDVTGI